MKEKSLINRQVDHIQFYAENLEPELPFDESTPGRNPHVEPSIKMATHPTFSDDIRKIQTS